MSSTAIKYHRESGPDPILSVRDLTVSFGASPVVRGVDLDVYANEVLCIVGESGSGKSVTALSISGLLPPTAEVAGSIKVGSLEVVGADETELRSARGHDIGFVFQDPATTLNPVLQVGRQITEGQVVIGALPRNAAGARAADLLREVDIANPAGRAREYPHEFSGGMRQRAVIAMAMAGTPSLIIADEPTTALDVTVQAQVLSVLARRQAETGAAVVLITHDLGVVAEVAHRVAVMYGGRIVETGPVEDIFRNPQHPYTKSLLLSLPSNKMIGDRLYSIPGHPPTPDALPTGCVFHPRCPVGHDRPLCATDDPALLPQQTNRRTACHFSNEVETIVPPTASEGTERPITGDPLLVVRDLKVHFPIKSGLLRRTVGHVRAVDGVSLTVRAGETVSLVGESGCGKTTTSRAIMGLSHVTAGEAWLGDQSIVGLSREKMRKVRRQLQYVFQDPYSSLNPVASVADIVAEPLHIHGLFDEMGGAAYIADLFDMVGLSRSMLTRYPSEFSGGQRQRIGIARALALKPKLLIMDEPVAALDVSIQAQVLNLLRTLQEELQLAYLFVAHNLSVVRHISDRVAVMYLGRIVEEGTRDEIYARPLHPYTQSLLSAVPVPDPSTRHLRQRIVLEGEIPNPAAPPTGCTFHPRCFRVTERCRRESPDFAPCGTGGSKVACHHAEPFDPLCVPRELVEKNAR